MAARKPPGIKKSAVRSAKLTPTAKVVLESPWPKPTEPVPNWLDRVLLIFGLRRVS